MKPPPKKKKKHLKVIVLNALKGAVKKKKHIKKTTQNKCKSNNARHGSIHPSSIIQTMMLHNYYHYYYYYYKKHVFSSFLSVCINKRTLDSRKVHTLIVIMAFHDFHSAVFKSRVHAVHGCVGVAVVVAAYSLHARIRGKVRRIIFRQCCHCVLTNEVSKIGEYMYMCIGRRLGWQQYMYDSPELVSQVANRGHDAINYIFLFGVETAFTFSRCHDRFHGLHSEFFKSRGQAVRGCVGVAVVVVPFSLHARIRGKVRGIIFCQCFFFFFFF